MVSWCVVMCGAVRCCDGVPCCCVSCCGVCCDMLLVNHNIDEKNNHRNVMCVFVLYIISLARSDPKLSRFL